MFVADRILALLAERPVLTAAQIRKALPHAKRKSIVSAIARLSDKGQIESAGWGFYRLPVNMAGRQPEPAKKQTVLGAIRARVTAVRLGK
jgi:predicted transcriptional regulator of viral defense system